jgi:signal transduction histidine kinase
VLTVKRAVYLLLSLGLGTTWFVILVVGLSTGIGLLITLLGIPILIGVLYATRPMADLERALVAGLLEERTAGRYRRPQREGAWASITARLAEPQTWKDVAYLACQFPLGIVWFALTLLAIVLPPSLILAPAYFWIPDDHIDVFFWHIDSWLEAIALVPIGVLLIVPARYLIDCMGIAHGYWARLLLHSEPDPELTAEVVDARSAQARIIAAADAERRRIERDLHDGAQQRLVALSLKLGMARKRLGDDADGLTLQLVDEAQEESRAALVELRDLARGIHPSVLTDRGLSAALHELAGRSSVPTEVVEAPEARLYPAVESTAYFVRRGVPRERRQVRARVRGDRPRALRGRTARGGGRRRRRRRGRGRTRLGTARPRRPGERAQRHARGREPAGSGHTRTSRDPHCRGLVHALAPIVARVVRRRRPRGGDLRVGLLRRR